MPIYWIAHRTANTPVGQQVMKKVTGEIERGMALAAAGAAILWAGGEMFIALFEGEEDPDGLFGNDESCVETTSGAEGLPGNASKSEFFDAGWQRIRKFSESGAPEPMVY